MKREMSPSEVEAEIADRTERLKAKGVCPVAEEVNENEATAEAEHRREARRKDTLRRLKSPVLVQRNDDGSLVFKHDLQVREGPRHT